MVPAVSIGFLRLIGVWSSDFPLTDSNGSAVAVAVGTAAAVLIAYWWTRFSVLFAIVVGATLVAAQFLAVAGSGPVTGDDRATAALIAGGALVIVGVFLDAFGRRRDAFWFHALGLFGAAAGLVFFVVEPSRDPDRGCTTRPSAWTTIAGRPRSRCSQSVSASSCSGCCCAVTAKPGESASSAGRRRTSPLVLEHPLLEPRSAVEREDVAGHVAGEVGYEVRARMCDLVFAAESSERNAPQQLLAELFGRPESGARLLGVDRARCDGVHTDPVLRPLDRERSREVDDTGFRCCGMNGAGAPGPGVARD